MKFSQSLVSLACVMLALGSASAQVVQAEYFVDQDPGQGLAIPISVSTGNDVTLNFSVNIGGLASGFHTLYVRALSSAGVWSIAYAHPFFKPSPASAPEADILAMEYFVDADPGQGAGNPINVSSGQDVTGSFAVDLSGVPPGFHTLYVRARDGDGVWSIHHAHPFYKVYPPVPGKPDITAVEYFIDSDPGLGLGTQSPITPGQNVTGSFAVDLSGVPPGFHTLYVRGLDRDGVWSVHRAHPFYKAFPGPPVPPAITRLEYFFHRSVPTPIRSVASFAPALDVTVSFAPDFSGLSSDSSYTMHLYAVDESGVRSIVYVPRDSTLTDVEENPTLLIPEKLELTHNYPNPFNPQTTIRFGLPARSHVRLVIYNVLGQEVVEIINESLPAGYHQVIWNGQNSRHQGVSSGMYIYRLISEDKSLTHPMLLVR